MRRAAELIGLAAIAVMTMGLSQPKVKQAPESPDPNAPKTAILQVGDTLPGTFPARSKSRLGIQRRYSGLYFRTFEGSDFQPDVRPNAPFQRDVGLKILAIDKKTVGQQLIPLFRSEQPFETNFVEFVGRPASDKSGKAIELNGLPVVWVDQFLRVERVPDAEVKWLAKDGTIVSGVFCPSNQSASKNCL